MVHSRPLLMPGPSYIVDIFRSWNQLNENIFLPHVQIQCIHVYTTKDCTQTFTHTQMHRHTKKTKCGNTQISIQTYTVDVQTHTFTQKHTHTHR